MNFRSIPFDSFVLEAVMRDLQPYIGGRVQDIRQPGDCDLALGLYAGGREAMLFLSCDPLFFRAHLITRRPGNQPQPPQFLAALRSRIENSRLADARQIPFERVLELVFETQSGTYRLVAELMGKHSNLIFIDPEGKVMSAAKWVGKGKSSRPIQPGVRFQPAPVLSGATAHGSRFFRELVAAGGDPAKPEPVLVPGTGAYPISVQPLGLQELPRESISIALEQHYAQAIPEHQAEALRSSLLSQLDRVLLARETALNDLRMAEEAGGRAGQWQRWGELILAYGPASEPGQATLEAFDYDGTPLSIKLDPEEDFKSNANRYFDRAKKAKGRMGLVKDQIARIEADEAEVRSLREEVAQTSRLIRLRELQDEARRRRWLTEQRTPTTVKEERPYQGHRIRELLAPGGFTVLYGETAEANDYLTLRVAKSNDYWLHVRGGVSAHVVIQTRNEPERVQKELLLFAAKIAVQNSPSKHSGYVPVDYTLKKYVRKPKGAAKGTALYTHEKTLHVDT